MMMPTVTTQFLSLQLQPEDLQAGLIGQRLTEPGFLFYRYLYNRISN